MMFVVLVERFREDGPEQYTTVYGPFPLIKEANEWPSLNNPTSSPKTSTQSKLQWCKMPITRANVSKYIPCSFERLHQVFIEPITRHENDPKYIKLRKRLQQIIDSLQKDSIRVIK